jgi:hypothetical protein
MKCVIKNDESEVKRVNDEKASELVDTGSFSYCGKEVWKKRVRDKAKEKNKK